MFTIRTINSTFYTEGEYDLSDTDEALTTGVRGALMIAADEIYGGTTASVVEVAIEDQRGDLVSKSAVTISVAPLATRSNERRPAPVEANDY